MFIPKCFLQPYINNDKNDEIVEAFRQVQVFDENELKEEESSLEFEKHMKKE